MISPSLHTQHYHDVCGVELEMLFMFFDCCPSMYCIYIFNFFINVLYICFKVCDYLCDRW